MDLNHLTPVNLVDIYPSMGETSPMASDIEAVVTTGDTPTMPTGDIVLVGVTTDPEEDGALLSSKWRASVAGPFYGPCWRNRKGTKHCTHS